MTQRRMRVATVITRLTAGAGGVALRGALALNPDRYAVVILTGGTGANGQAMDRTEDVLTGVDAVKDAPAGDLLAEAYAAGLGVVRVPALVPEISPRKDAAALRILSEQLREGRFDVVHTHSAKGGALGRIAASRAH